MTNLRIAALLALAACNPSPFREVNANLEAAPHSTDVSRAPRAAPAFRVSVAAMESPRGTYAEYARLFEEVGRRMGRETDFIQRRTYREVNDLLVAGGLDAALLCTGGYLELERSAPGAVEVLAVPIIKGADTFESLIIVPVASPALQLSDLAGKRFAYTDELSLTGHTYVLKSLRELGKNPDAFFGSTLFTNSHDRSIAAVARGLVEGAAVHSVIFNHLLARDPSLSQRVRVIQRSPPFGMTPVVVSTRLPLAERERLRAILQRFGDDPAGAALLDAIQIDRFAPPAPALFESAARVLETRP